jgi:hypothetical protein
MARATVAKTTQKQGQQAETSSSVEQAKRALSPDPYGDVLALQGMVGNGAVNRLLRGGRSAVVQAKLTVSQPGDKYEQEADRIAEQVMRMSEPTTLTNRTMAVSGEPHSTQRACSKCRGAAQQLSIEEDEEERLRAKPIAGQHPAISPTTHPSLSVLQGRGQPLSISERVFFEPRFGYDFSNVRIYTDQLSASSLNAEAYTIGSNVVFDKGEYLPGTSIGRKLLAHELVHIVQQGKCAKNSINPSIHRIERQFNTNLIQGRWRSTNLETESDVSPPVFEGFDAGGSSAMYGSVVPPRYGFDIRAEARETGIVLLTAGTTARVPRQQQWTRYTFEHDGTDNSNLFLRITALTEVNAIAQDRLYAQGGAVVVGVIRERTQPNPTTEFMFDPLESAGESTAITHEGDLDMTIPNLGEIHLPITYARQGSPANPSDSLVPPTTYPVEGEVGIPKTIEVELAAVATAIAALESIAIGLEHGFDRNIAEVKAIYSLDWDQQEVSTTVPEELLPAVAGTAQAEDPGWWIWDHSLISKEYLGHAPNRGPAGGAVICFTEAGSVMQVGIYDANGFVIGHIDRPHGGLGWHYHVFPVPGHEEIGHGRGSLHNPIENLEEQMRNWNFPDDWDIPPQSNY